MDRKLKSLIPVVVISIVIIALFIVWFVMFPASAWAGTPNYLWMYLEFVFTRPFEAFLTVSTGPGSIVAWVFAPIYLLMLAHVVLYFIGKRRNQQYTIISKYYLVYLVVLGLFAISFQNASQHYNWYWNPTLNAPGYVDTWTHITSPWLLGALIAPLALERLFGWNRKHMWFFVFGVLMITALIWEIGETMDVYVNPTPTYFNYPMDSLKDMIMGAGIGTVLACWIYERLVSDLGE